MGTAQRVVCDLPARALGHGDRDSQEGLGSVGSGSHSVVTPNTVSPGQPCVPERCCVRRCLYHPLHARTRQQGLFSLLAVSKREKESHPIPLWFFTPLLPEPLHPRSTSSLPTMPRGTSAPALVTPQRFVSFPGLDTQLWENQTGSEPGDPKFSESFSYNGWRKWSKSL